MIVTTTPSVEGQITGCKGIAAGGAVTGANVVRGTFAGITGIIGGRSCVRGNMQQDAGDTALLELEQWAGAAGKDAAAGAGVDYGAAGSSMVRPPVPD